MAAGFVQETEINPLICGIKYLTNSDYKIIYTLLLRPRQLHEESILNAYTVILDRICKYKNIFRLTQIFLSGDAPSVSHWQSGLQKMPKLHRWRENTCNQWNFGPCTDAENLQKESLEASSSNYQTERRAIGL